MFTVRLPYLMATFKGEGLFFFSARTRSHSSCERRLLASSCPPPFFFVFPRRRPPTPAGIILFNFGIGAFSRTLPMHPSFGHSRAQITELSEDRRAFVVFCY